MSQLDINKKKKHIILLAYTRNTFGGNKSNFFYYSITRI